MNTKVKYEIGGRASLNGKWYKIQNIDAKNYIISLELNPPRWNWLPMSIFGPDDYRPPEPEAHEWIPAHMGIASALNGALTEHYGDPTERTYNGEPAEQFGLKKNDNVLWKDVGMKKWCMCMFKILDHGNLWRKLPKVLTQEGGAK